MTRILTLAGMGPPDAATERPKARVLCARGADTISLKGVANLKQADPQTAKSVAYM